MRVGGYECTCAVGNQEQMLHAKSGGRGGRAGHSYEMTSHHSHTPAQECWENRQGGRVGGWVGATQDGRMSLKGGTKLENKEKVTLH